LPVLQAWRPTRLLRNAGNVWKQERRYCMSKGTEQDRSRRAFLTRAGGVAAALVAAARVEGAQQPSRSASQARDRGLWATWYDLPEAGRSEHLAWVHETYIPALLKRPGYLWAAHYATIPNETAARLRHPPDPA